jgi:cysteine desulfuration protein SufE
MPNFPPTISEITEEFQELEDWDERYDLIIDLGRELPKFPDQLQTDENIVQGCMSTVWMATRVSSEDNEKRIEILADSDSIIVKGLIVLLMSFYSGRPAAEIVQKDAEEFFSQLGLNQHLSPQRRNGLYSMVKRLKLLAAEHAAA